LRPLPKREAELEVLRRVVWFRPRGWRMDLLRTSGKVGWELVFCAEMANARSWKAAFEKMGVVSGEKSGGTLAKEEMKAVKC
jgi:hypothetical protein